MSDKAVGSNGVAIVRDFVESRLGSDSNQNAAVLSAINSLDEKPLNGAGLAVLRDWINSRIAAMPGLDENTADATAYAGDISEGKTAYARGAKVTGTLPEVVGVNLYQSGNIITGPGDIPNGSGDYDIVNRTVIGGTMTNDRILREGARVSIYTRSSLFGDADPSDVLAGKTFTAKDGKETGTIVTKSVDDLTVSGPTVSVPAGYFSTAASKSVATVEQATPVISVDANGLITVNVTQGAGYVSAGLKSDAQQLPVKTSTDMTVSGATVTAPAGYYTAAQSKSVATATQATPSVTIDNATGLVTASATQTAGYVTAGTKSGTLQLSTQAAATITPGTSAKTAVAANKWTTGAVNVSGDANLTAANIKSGVSIFGVSGSLTPGVDTSDATAVASDIAYGKTAYVNGSKVTGNVDTWAPISSLSVGLSSTGITSGILNYRHTFNVDRLFRTGSTIIIGNALSNFGTATASDVASGKTFTSTAGYKVTGTASSNEITWTNYRLSSSSSYGAYYAAYGNGRFVVASSSGTNVLYSTDGSTWNTTSIGVSGIHKGLTYAYDKFILLKYNTNTCLTSEDGITWTQIPLPVTGKWSTVGYGKRMIVGVPNEGTDTVYSADGVTWQKSVVPTAGDYRKVVYGKGKFILFGYGLSKALYSFDGVVWYNTGLGATYNINAAAYGKGRFVALSYDTNKGVYSLDGSTWVKMTLPLSAEWWNLIYAEGMFVAIARSNNVGIRSRDGINWTTMNVPVSSTWYDIAYGNGRFVVPSFAGDVLVGE